MRISKQILSTTSLPKISNTSTLWFPTLVTLPLLVGLVYNFDFLVEGIERCYVFLFQYCIVFTKYKLYMFLTFFFHLVKVHVIPCASPRFTNFAITTFLFSNLCVCLRPSTLKVSSVWGWNSRGRCCAEDFSFLCQVFLSLL